MPAYLDAQHGMVGHLNPHMGMSPKGDSQMHHSLAQSLQQEEEDQYDDDGRERDGEEGGGLDVRGKNPKSTQLSFVSGGRYCHSCLSFVQ